MVTTRSRARNMRSRSRFRNAATVVRRAASWAPPVLAAAARAAASNYVRSTTRRAMRSASRRLMRSNPRRGIRAASHPIGDTLVSRSKMLQKFGVQDESPRYYLKTGSLSVESSLGSKAYATGLAGAGLKSLPVLDEIYTAEGLTDNDQSVVFTHQGVEYIFKNQSDMGLYLKIHECVFKRDFGSAFGGFSSIISDGFSDIGLSNSVEQEIPSHIRMNTKFNHFQKIVRTTTIALQPGETKKYLLKRDGVWKQNFYYKKETDTNGLKGAHWLLIETHGVPVHDSTTTTNISLANTALDIFWSMRYVYRTPNKDTPIHANVTVGHTEPAAPVGFVDEDIAKSTVET